MVSPTATLRVSRALAVLYGALLLLIIAAVNLGGTYTLFGWLGHVPYGDKLGHFLLFGMMGLLLDHAAKRHSLRPLGLMIPTAPMALLVFVAAEELSQRWLSTRTFDLGDLAADFAGIGLFVVLGRVLDQMSARRQRAGGPDAPPRAGVDDGEPTG